MKRFVLMLAPAIVAGCAAPGETEHPLQAYRARMAEMELQESARQARRDERMARRAEEERARYAEEEKARERKFKEERERLHAEDAKREADFNARYAEQQKVELALKKNVAKPTVR